MTENNSQKLVTVIIPTYHDNNRLQICINALEKQTMSSKEFEVIIVNNDPKIPVLLTNVPQNVRIVDEEKKGSYAARNKGLSLANTSFVAFTDSDCIPDSNWLKNGIGYLLNNRQILRIGGRIQLFKTEKTTELAAIYEKAFAFQQERFVNKQGMAATGNMMTYKQLFDDVGLFSDNMMSGGDSEWGRRAAGKGYPISYIKSSLVLHPTRESFKEIFSKAMREAGGHLAIVRKKPSISVLVHILKGILPPFESIRDVLKNKELHIGEKILALALRYIIKLASVKEKLALLLQLKEPERK